jgi:hypothetical protein
MVETKSRRELAASAAVSAATVGVVMAAMSDGNALVDGTVSAAAALIAFVFWTWTFSRVLASE